MASLGPGQHRWGRSKQVQEPKHWPLGIRRTECWGSGLFSAGRLCWDISMAGDWWIKLMAVSTKILVLGGTF